MPGSNGKRTVGAMTITSGEAVAYPNAEVPSRPLTPAQRHRLEHRFEAIIFDWDGTAIGDRRADGSPVRRLVEDACALGMDIGIVSGTHVGNVDRQLGARPEGPGLLHLLLNRGSEVYEVDVDGPRLVWRRTATPAEEAALSEAAELTIQRLAARGLDARVISQRLNRRKIDLIPDPAWSDPPKARIAELVRAVESRIHERGFQSLGEVVALAETAAAEAGLPDARVTTDAKHVEIGLTDKSDSARWFFRLLARRGVAAGLTLIAGDELGRLSGEGGSDSRLLIPEAERATVASVGVEPGGVPAEVLWVGGGPPAFLALLEDQVARRRRREVPAIDPDPEWTVAVDGIDLELERAHEALLTVADGRIGTRGTPLGEHPSTAPAVLAAGLYRGEGAQSTLLRAPLWNQLPFDIGKESSVRRVLDLRTVSLRQEITVAGASLNALLFASLAHPGTVCLRAQGSSDLLGDAAPLVAPPGTEVEAGKKRGRSWMLTRGSTGGLAAAASEDRAGDRATATLDRLGRYEGDPERQPEARTAFTGLAAAEERGFERLLVEHRAAWGRRWEEADVRIEGDPDLQLAVRFALGHLMASVADSGQAAVGARGLSGSAYGGHVFWDACVFVLPFLAATHPEAARAVLEYRVRRLPDALAAARAVGRAGARFPWESAASGFDVTPTSLLTRAGERLAVTTGKYEEHVVAGVAWAVSCYLDWTADTSFARGSGGRILVETARYWASRAEVEADGRAHIRQVTGPDEYHERVDDNAYTNVMARWNLRRAAALDPSDAQGVTDSERRRWLEIAGSLVDGYDPESGRYEQFAGFWGLEPLVVSEVAPTRPIAADLLLGSSRVAGAQIVKQADVLMLHHLVPDEVEPDSLGPNLSYYEPRTAHASSLSPGVHASLFARAGDLAKAGEALRLAARIDLDDVSKTTAGGLHLAAMGSVWQALAFGFAGIRSRAEVLELDPRLPPDCNGLELRLRFRGVRLRVRIDPEGAAIASEAPLAVRLVGSAATVTAGDGTFQTVS